jgi:ribosome-binding protein aMBF1 (putative translation factor)
MSKKPISPIGRRWDDEFERKIFTPEEIAASDLRVAMMIEISEAMAKKGISHEKLETLSGVKRQIIERIERGSTSPQLTAVLNVLAPLGKTLYIGDIESPSPAKRSRKPAAGRTAKVAAVNKPARTKTRAKA